MEKRLVSWSSCFQNLSSILTFTINNMIFNLTFDQAWSYMKWLGVSLEFSMNMKYPHFHSHFLFFRAEIWESHTHVDCLSQKNNQCMYGNFKLLINSFIFNQIFQHVVFNGLDWRVLVIVIWLQMPFSRFFLTAEIWKSYWWLVL